MKIIHSSQGVMCI